MEGQREFKLMVDDKIRVIFDVDSLVQFVDENDEVLVQLDPTELSLIYGAYRQMEKEKLEDDGIRQNGRAI